MNGREATVGQGALAAARVPYAAIGGVVIALYAVALAASMTGMEIFSSVLMLLVGAWWIAERPAVRLPSLWVPLAAFSAVLVLGVLLGGAKPMDKIYDIARLRYVLLYLALHVYFRHYPGGESRAWLKPLAIAALVIGVYGVAQHFHPLDLIRPVGKKTVLYAIEETKTGPLVLGAFKHHLTFSNVFFFFAALFTALGLGAPRRRWWALALGLLLFLDCVWTQSRVAWIAVPVGLLLLAAGRSRKAAVWALVACVTLVNVSFALDAGFRERWVRTFRKGDIYNLDQRTHLWNAQWAMFRENPWLGIGWNNNGRRAKEYVDRLYGPGKDNFYGHAHSEPMQILSTTGILGAAAFLWIWWAVFARAVRLWRNYPRDREEHWLVLGIFVAFVGFHIQGLTQWNFGDSPVLHSVVFFWAVLTALPDRPVL